MRGNEFKRIKSVLGVVLLATFLVCTMIVPSTVTAKESHTVPALDTSYVDFNDLSKGDVIHWDWHTPNGEWLSFWIVDEQGNQYETQDASSSSGSFQVNSDGDWQVKWTNLHESDVELEYDVSVNYAEDDYTSFFTSWYGIAAIMVIAGGILLIYVYEKKKKEMEELKESQQPQQQTHQQPSAPPSQSQQQQPQQAPRQPQQPQSQQAPPPPAQGSSTQQQDGKPCPECDTPMRYVQQYDRWYCDNCGKYQ